MPFINLTKKFVFIGNARTGSTSIYVYLNNVCQNDETIWEDGLNALPNSYHMSVQDTINKYPFCKDFTFFCFVRNPYTRMLSSFIEFTTDKGHFPWSSELLKFKNFEDFSLNFNNTEIKNDIHFIPLSEQIKCNEKINLIICKWMMYLIIYSNLSLFQQATFDLSLALNFQSIKYFKLCQL